MNQYFWDGDQLWWKGQGYDHPTNPHRYTGIDSNSKLFKSESLKALKILIADLLNKADPDLSRTCFEMKSIPTRRPTSEPIQQGISMTEGKFTVTCDLDEATFSKLLAHCQKSGKPVGDVAPQAIASYLRQAEILADQTAKLSA